MVDTQAPNLTLALTLGRSCIRLLMLLQGLKKHQQSLCTAQSESDLRQWLNGAQQVGAEATYAWREMPKHTDVSTKLLPECASQPALGCSDRRARGPIRTPVD